MEIKFIKQNLVYLLSFVLIISVIVFVLVLLDISGLKIFSSILFLLLGIGLAIFYSNINKKFDEVEKYIKELKNELTKPIVQPKTQAVIQPKEEKDYNVDIEESAKILDRFNNLDFTAKLNDSRITLSNQINKLGDIISSILSNNKANGLTLVENTQLLLDDMLKIHSTAHDCALILEKTVVELESITKDINNSISIISNITQHANEVTEAVAKGQELANKTTTSMNDISEAVLEINESLSVIDQITLQTNILSLNAAVEAATAGEAGKGFAVVAGEVRNLANRSAEAAKEIKQLVENANAIATEGKDIANNMIEGYTGLNDSISHTLKNIDIIEKTSQDQQNKITSINQAVFKLDNLIQENASKSNDARMKIKKLQIISDDILKSVEEENFINKDNIKAKEIKIDEKDLFLENNEEWSVL